MKGLALSKEYYKEYAPRLLADFPQLKGKAAFGLVGEGSHCFGFDDAISRDHDFGPGFCIWLKNDDYKKYGKSLQSAYERLPHKFLGFEDINPTVSDRLGVFSIGDFYYKFLGTSVAPASNQDWFLLAETSLAVCTNGEVFSDPTGEFTQFRQTLLSFYPEDVLRKKIAARAAIMSQAGQYNLLRLMKRNDKVGALLATARFTEATLSMMYLLNRRYMPFYKWAFYGSADLNVLKICRPLLIKLTDSSSLSETYELAEKICHHVSKELQIQGLSNCNSDFLQDHLNDIMSGIKDPAFSSMHPMVDFSF